MSKEKEVYNVWINQCWECDDISNIVVKNAETVEIMDDIEEKIKKKYLLEDDGWNQSYKLILKSKKNSGNVTINLRKYKIYAEVETHKCCRCGGNY